MPRNLKWFFAAGVVLALFLVDYLSRQRNPFSHLHGGPAPRLAVLYVDDTRGMGARPGEADSLQRALIAALSRTPGLQVLSPDSLRSLRHSMGQPDAGHLGPAAALGVAQLGGCQNLIVGTLGGSPDREEVSLRVIDAHNGREVGTAHCAGGGTSASVVMCDSLSAAVKRVLTEM